MTVAPVGLDLTAPSQRKRGAALENAILEAAYAELSQAGYTAFSVESVAARAHTGKGSIYRRWPTKQLLVLDALCAHLPTAQECGFQAVIPDSVTTVEALHLVARKIAKVLASPAGAAMRAVTCEGVSDPELGDAVNERFQGPRRQAMLALLERGAARGEVRPEAVTPLVADLLPAVLAHRMLLLRESVTEQTLTAIVEHLLVPLIEPTR
jgi:AcrR family transcriptional regulator